MTESDSGKGKNWYQEEQDWIDDTYASEESGSSGPTGVQEKIEVNPAAGEPYVHETTSSRFGIALSGGGIRSATFGLGVLQGLAKIGLLDRADYLSTVSGGGYIGGFWTSWKLAPDEDPGKSFPDAETIGVAGTGDNSAPGVEAGEIRHLREFSNFLTPRTGLMSTHFWEGVAAILSGMIPSLLISVAILTLVVCSRWLFETLVSQPFQPFGDSWQQMLTGIPQQSFEFSIVLWSVVFALLTALPTLMFEYLDQRRRLASEVACRHREPSGSRNSTPAAWWLRALWVFAVVLLVTYGGAMLLKSTHGDRLRERTHEVIWAVSEEPPSQVSVQVKISDAGRETESEYRLSETRPPMQSADRRTESQGASVRASAQDLPRPELTQNEIELHLWLAFAPAVLWICSGIVLLICRYLWAWIAPWLPGVGPPASDYAVSRMTGRLVRSGLMWAGLTVLWVFSIRLYHHFGDSKAVSTGGLSLSLTSLAGAFAWLKNGLVRRPGDDTDSGFGAVLRSLLPQLLAYAFIGLLIVVIGALLIVLHESIGPKVLLLSLGVIGLVFAVFCLLLRPDALGLHAYYRDRIARAYLGARFASDEDHWKYERPVDPRDDDNFPLSHLASAKRRFRRHPFHLICGTANDLRGDSVAGLGRGAVSITFSPLHVTLKGAARRHADTEPYTLASVLTASGAAFNSLMGSNSTRLGPAVTFLMATLNLRLGLWVRSPLEQAAAAEGQEEKLLRLPGFLFLKEFLSDASVRKSVAPKYVKAGSGPPQPEKNPWARHVHVSDGGHFENLGLYELVRRHCTNIVVTDCGADPDSTFVDLGNAIRRIRADFGVEIGVEAGVLMPKNEGHACQHVAVGRIRYPDGDIGTLLVIKPVLTGDEPDDVRQYKAENPLFPQESTGDQWYSESQWESYRRLGEHAAMQIFSREDRQSSRNVDDLFRRASTRWAETAGWQSDRMVEITERFDRLIQALAQTAPESPLRELIRVREGSALRLHAGADLPPDAHHADRNDGDEAEGGPGDAGQADFGTARRPQPDRVADSEAETAMILRVVQVMEDAMIALKLEETADHPLNSGWMKLFRFWVSTSVFRAHWPFAQPFFSMKFRLFVSDWLEGHETARAEEFEAMRRDDRETVGDIPVKIREQDGRNIVVVSWREAVADWLNSGRPAPIAEMQRRYEELSDSLRQRFPKNPPRIRVVFEPPGASEYQEQNQLQTLAESLRSEAVPTLRAFGFRKQLQDDVPEEAPGSFVMERELDY